MKKQYSFSFDADKCLKCWACELACQQWRGIKPGTVKLRQVTEVTRGSYPNVRRVFLSLSCRHCAKPPCAAACPTGAITKRSEDGIVVVESQKCIGCRTCLEACPFGVPRYAEDGTMQKCDMCLDRLAAGQRPICAETCPTGALFWDTLPEIARRAGLKGANKIASAL